MPVLHLDMDSFFATAEQQARPHLRGKPLGVAPVISRGGTIIASSVEAKKLGVGTGTKVAEAKALIPDIALVKPDPPKYRAIHHRFREVLTPYTSVVKPRSIDEVALWLDDQHPDRRPPAEIGQEIKQRIRDEVGEWLSSSVGIGPNWLLAKTASAMEKPDGLMEITRGNTREVLGGLKLRDLCGIARRLEARLNLAGIATPVDLYDLPPWELKRRLGMIGYYWHLRLHGYSIDTLDWPVRSIGHSSVIPQPTSDVTQLKPLLHKLCEKVGRRLRAGSWQATTVSVGGGLADQGGWGDGWGQQTRTAPLEDAYELYRHSCRLLDSRPLPGPLRVLAVRATSLTPSQPRQLSLLDTGERRQRAVTSLDAINDRWGEFTIHPAGIKAAADLAGDSIAFGRDMVTRHRI